MFSGNNVSVSKVGGEAVAALARVHRESFDKCWNEGEFASLLTVEGTHAWLALADDRPVGMMLCRVLAEQAEILTTGVIPACRRKGIAARLLAQSLEFAATTGAMVFFLEVSQDNAAAQQLYGKAGFRVSGRRKDYYRRADKSFTDALVMRRELA